MLFHFLFFTCCLSTTYAQSLDIVKDEKLLKNALESEYYALDSSAQAVVLYETGGILFYANRMERKYERIIKYYGKEGIDDLGNIDLAEDNGERNMNIRVTTYNLENGVIVKQQLEKSEVMKEELDNETKVKKIYFPSLKKGSIVHYSYTLNTQGSGFYIPEWKFQTAYPKVFSKYTLNVPSYLRYNVLERTSVALKSVTREKDLANCEACSFTTELAHERLLVWVRRNVPAYKKEPFSRSGGDFKECIRLVISEYLYKQVWFPMFKSWDQVTTSIFLNSEAFGQINGNNNFLNSQVKELTDGKATDLEKAKAIYKYVQDQVDIDERSNKTNRSISRAFENKRGTEYSANMLMIAMLKKAGLQCRLILGSDVYNGKLLPTIPRPYDVNYLVGELTIDKKVYLLDAANKFTPFGFLADNHYNGYARVLVEKNGDYSLDPDLIKDKNVTLVNIEKDSANNQILIKMNKQYGIYSSIKMREKISKMKQEEIDELVKKSFTTVSQNHKLLKGEFLGIKEIEKPLSLVYELQMPIDSDESNIYFDPYWSRFFETNPFPDVKREYPIEFDYLVDENYVFNFHVPHGYVVDDYPKSSLVKYGDGTEMQFKNMISYSETDNTLSLNSRFTTSKTFFNATEYEHIRQFFDKMITEQKKKIVLERKSK